MTPMYEEWLLEAWARALEQPEHAVPLGTEQYVDAPSDVKLFLRFLRQLQIATYRLGFQRFQLYEEYLHAYTIKWDVPEQRAFMDELERAGFVIVKREADWVVSVKYVLPLNDFPRFTVPGVRFLTHEQIVGNN